MKVINKYVVLFISLALIFSIQACKTDGSPDVAATNNGEGRKNMIMQAEEPLPDEEVRRMNEAGRATLEYRYKEYGKESIAAIEMDRWYYEFVAVGADIKRVVDGSWIDLYPDMSYEYGDSLGVIGRGDYHFVLGDKDLLLLVDDNDKVKVKEFEAKIVGPTMVLVGQATYKDNYMQMKLGMDNIREVQ